MLRRQTNELARLAQENHRSKTSLANTSPENNAPESSDTKPFRSQVNSLVNFGETLVTGGWETGPDRRTLVFVKPELGTTDDGKQTVTLHSMGIEVPNSLLATHGLGAVATESNQTEQHGQLSPSPAADALLKQLAAEPNTQQFRIGNIATFPGQSAQLQIGSAGDGINFTATPNLAADGKGFDLRFDTVLSPTQNRQGTH